MDELNGPDQDWLDAHFDPSSDYVDEDDIPEEDEFIKAAWQIVAPGGAGGGDRMAIDAVIVKVQEAGEDLILILGSRLYKDGAGHWGTSIPGQSVLRIKSFTYRPVVGQFIWGGSDTARTVDNIPGAKKQEYKRTSFGYLVEVANG